MAGSLGTAIPDKLREIHEMLVSELNPRAERRASHGMNRTVSQK